jgi:hypothetical protein
LKDFAMPRSSQEAAKSHRATAQDQGGYFAAKQAKSAAYDYPHLDYHVSTNALERIEHGLYRLADMPVAEGNDLRAIPRPVASVEVTNPRLATWAPPPSRFARRK